MTGKVRVDCFAVSIDAAATGFVPYASLIQTSPPEPLLANNMILEATKVFAEMPESVVSWTAVTFDEWYGYQKFDSHGEVVRLFLDMVGNGVECEVTT